MRIVIALAALLTFSTATYADQFANSDLHLYLRVHATRSFVENFVHQRLDDQDYFITRGGALLSVMAGRIDDDSFTNMLVRGVGQATQLANLKRILSENQIGARTDCEIDTGGDTLGLYEITWYGKGSRRNSFVAVLGPAGASGFPACPPQVERIIQAIGDYWLHVVNKPGTEVLNAR